MNKQETIKGNMLALARRRRGKKKGGSARSQMLRMVMPMLSREQGDALAKAIEDRNVTNFRITWDKIKAALSDKLASTSSAVVLDLESVSAEDAYNEMISDRLETVAGATDFSRLLLGNARIPQLTRELIANGRVELANAVGTEFVIVMSSISVPRTSSTQRNPQMKVSAELSEFGSKERPMVLDFKGELAAACSEIVINALSIIDEQAES